LIKIENSSEYIGDVTDLDARDPDNRPNPDLHKKPHFCRNEKWCILAHLSEFFGGFFHIAFARAIEFIDGIEIVHETYERDDSSEYEEDKKPTLVRIAQNRVEKYGKKEEVEIENTSDTDRHRFPFVSIGCGVIKKSKAEKKLFPNMENKE